MKDGGASSKGVEQFLEERLNISKDQLVYRASSSLRSDPDQKTQSPCINEAGCQMPLTDGLTCAAQELSSDVEKSELLRKWSAVKFEGMDQCPVQVIHEKSEVTTAREELVPNVSSQSTRITSSEVQILGTICWCVIFGIVVYWCVRVCSVLYGKVLDIMKRTRTDLKNKNNQKKKYFPTLSKGRREWRGRLLILFLMSGVIGATWLFWFVKESAILWRTEMLTSMCDERARMLQDQFNVSMNHVHALAILVSTFHHGKLPSAIDQKTFAEYTERTAFERPLTSGVAYALKVVHSERKNFEKTYGWTIKKMKEEGHSAVHDYDLEKLDPSPDQDEYAPVIFSQESVSHIVSIDMMSVKEDRENILRTRASGKGALTPPFKLLKSNHIGVVLTFAVYDTTLPTDATPEQHTEATVGYLGASYDVPSLVETLLRQLASKQPIVVNVYDITNISSPIKMYGPSVRNTGPLHISNLDFGDPYRRHEMRCRFKHKPPPPWTAMLTSTGFLVITLLVGYIFRAAINRIAKVEGEYHEMMKLKVQAEAADLAKSQFLATVSHEIRTPMNGVIGMLQMLMNTDLNADQLDYALTAHSSGKDLITLINEVLDQAKVESGRLELETVQFDPRSVLDNVLSVFFDKVHDKGIELAVYVSESVPDLVVGDPGRFGQIVANLVGNSVKFTEGGHIFVSVHLTDEARTPLELKDEVLKQQLELARNGINRSYDTLSGLPVVDRWKSWQNFQKLSGFITEASEMIGLLVTVEDTGVGIMQDAQRRMFTPFMQANSSTSRTYGGTGIGLNISKCLVDIMGGEIGFVSEPGIGSTFSFALALRKCETNMLITKAHQLPSRSSEFRGMRALVIGGNNIRAQVTKYHLCRLGIYVDIATSLEFMRLHLSNIRHVSGKHLDMILFETDGFDEETTLALHCVLKDLSQGVKNNGFLNRSEMFLLATSSSIKHGQFKSTGYVDAVIMKPLTLNVLVTHFQEVFGAGYKKQQSNVKSSLQSVLSEKHILVVDDNAVNRRVAEGLLTRYGAKVTCVENGKTAVEFLRPPHKFDACFMDLQMPQMDGFEATRQIRCIENELNNMIQLGEASNETFGNSVLWHTPILAMTADVIQVTCDKRIKCGMDGYVLKPFEEEQLHSTLTHLFQSTH